MKKISLIGVLFVLLIVAALAAVLGASLLASGSSASSDNPAAMYRAIQNAKP
jgi:type II secretory pathway pseudopilin PulG